MIRIIDAESAGIRLPLHTRKPSKRVTCKSGLPNHPTGPTSGATAATSAPSAAATAGEMGSQIIGILAGVGIAGSGFAAVATVAAIFRTYWEVKSHSQQFKAIDKRFESLERKFESMERKFELQSAEMRLGFQNVEGRLESYRNSIEGKFLGQKHLNYVAVGAAVHIPLKRR